MYNNIFCPCLYTVIPPPVDVQATQSSSSAPVEVSWSPPVDHGAFNITGYRIFYGSGKNISLPTVATNIGLKVNEKYDSQIVFLRSESDQLHSELVYVTVGKLLAAVLKVLSKYHYSIISSHYQKMKDCALHVMQSARIVAQVKLVLLLE